MFIEDVQRWLAGVGRGAEPGGTEALPADFDLDRRRQVVWETLESMEPPAGAPSAFQPWRDTQWSEALAEWSAPQRLERWLQVFATAFEVGIGSRQVSADRAAAIDAALAGAIRGTAAYPGTWSRTVVAELERLAGFASRTTASKGAREELPSWCAENGLVRADGSPTGACRALLELRGRDAVEFALALGAELSVGPADSWRLSVAGLAELLTGDHAFDYDLPDPQESCRYHVRSVTRLVAMGLADGLYDDDADPPASVTRIHLHDDAHDLVARVAKEPDSRFRALARALLDLERGRVSVDGLGRTGTDYGDLSYARSVAHEIRNLVLPLSTGLEALWEELGQATPDIKRRQNLRDRIVRSVDRLSEFATEAVKLSAAVSEEEELVLARVVDDAIRATAVERNGRIVVHVESLGTTRVVGAARDWTSAFVNLLRNATQARAGQGNVWVSAEADAVGGLHVYIDDDGPGVTEDLRERIFGMGHSTRGGSGVGLADARRTAQYAGGSLVCEDAPERCGARFHFHLPPRSVR